MNVPPAAFEYKWDFFIAHAGNDQSSAEALYDLLEPHKVFLDSKSLELGDDWDRELPDAQRSSMITVVLVSSHTDRAYYQREEIAAAIKLGREDNLRHRVIPVYLETSENTMSTVPYGLQIKHGLEATKCGGLNGVASRLKESFARIKAKCSSFGTVTGGGTSESPKFQQTLVDAIAALSEEEVLPEVIVPLLTVLNPGRTTYATGTLDSSKFVVSFGSNSLKRLYVLAVHLRPISIHTTLREFEDAIQSVRNARLSGVTTEGGQTVIANEVWLISPYALSAEFRASIRPVLLASQGENIQFISGDELANLLADHTPDIASKLSRYSQPEIVGLISALSKHTEGRAFGVSSDRDINEFYVTASLSPYAKRAYAAIRNEVSVYDFEHRDLIPIGVLLKASDLFASNKTMERRIRDRSVQLLTKGVLDDFAVPITWKLQLTLDELREYYIRHSLLDNYHFLDFAKFAVKLKNSPDGCSSYIRRKLNPKNAKLLEAYDEHSETSVDLRRGLLNNVNNVLRSLEFAEYLRQVDQVSPATKNLLKKAKSPDQVVVANRIALADVYSEEVARLEDMPHDEINLQMRFELEMAFAKLTKNTADAISKCPEVLSENASLVRTAWHLLEKTERFVRVVAEHFHVVKPDTGFDDDVVVKAPIRVRVPEPAHLLKIDKVLLVEGPPGCGKTTLLKILAIDMLSRNRKVLYLPCFNISPAFKRRSLEDLVEKFSQGSINSPSDYEKSILVIDGLDEAPFDLSKVILSGFTKFQHIVVSTRIAYETKLRSEFFRVELAPFTNEERDVFFEKWFNSDPELVSQAKELVSRYPDLDSHTRLPLIASITASLLQNGIIPRTRAEIYGFRLELLLSRWDSLGGHLKTGHTWSLQNRPMERGRD